jgi:hypothetical protein
MGHTKGPWIMDGLMMVVKSASEPDKSLCMVTPYHPDAVANANLIAAAPELIEACEAALRCGLNDEGSGYQEALAGKTFDIISSAIAKAKGAA